LAITLMIVGGLLLIAVVVLLVLLFGRGTDNATVSTTTPSPTVSASPTQGVVAPEPVDRSARFTSFSAPTTVQCPQEGDKPEIQVSWTTANAAEVWYTAGNDDAKDDNYMQVPLSGNQSDLTDEHLFPCNHRETSDYTLTLVGPNGEHVSKHWTVRDLNWNG
jgi:hypothetical protein